MSSRAAALALFALAGCGWCGTKPEPVAPPPPPPSAPAGAAVVEQPAAVELTAVQGEVEVRRGAGGEWTAARVPLSLGLDDSIRTPAGGAATLRVGQDGSIEVRERTELSVRQLLVNRARFRVERGRVRATPGPSRVAVALESSGSSAVAESSTGSFAVFNDGKGLVAVVAEAGEVKLTSAGGDTVLAAGQGARVLGAAAPATEAVPRSVLLKVAWPEEKLTRQAAVTLRGEADPGALVSVNGKEMQVGPDGRFETEVPLAAGANPIAVRSLDRFGRTADESETLQVDRRPPPVKARTEGWQ
jgi:hypothetical protein